MRSSVPSYAPRRQVFWHCAPLASRAQNVHDPVHHFAHIDVALVAPALRRRDQRLDVRPFIVRQITRISQFAAVVAPAILRRPHWRPPSNQPTTLESQTIHMIQYDFGRTLRAFERAVGRYGVTGYRSGIGAAHQRKPSIPAGEG